MASAPWNETFETALRRGLPGLPAGEALPADVPLDAYGLDSLALIGVVGALETAFGVGLTGRVTVPVRTLTARLLWRAVETARRADGDDGRAGGAGTPGPSPWALA
ncbi:acyl carrier protein [Streptomyces mangrovisoli]|uniref:Carrier domain-containing protein n=1 Tax=Streptomyces mangrovisoli TaxID=1428628 RepID=A0A1J4P0U7_9ACTN|nr:acyl carrier protein [Streptomyces mangrovisoli]OIJ68224.1 hypothetical protein WN71_009315 [Streptomyces mangrovisoli]